MKLKHLLSLSLLGLLSVPAVAGQPQFTFEKVITKAAVTNQFYPRITAATSDATGGVYYSENASGDDIFYMADPLADPTGATFSVGVYDGAGVFGSGSHMGLSLDPNGTLYTCGSDDTKNFSLRITKSGSTFSHNIITLPSSYAGTGYIRLGGCAAVGPNRFVAPGYTDGSLHFFAINTTDSTAFLEGVVPAPSGFTGQAPAVYYADGKIYMTNITAQSSSSVFDGSNGGLYVWNSNGTHAGTNTPVQVANRITASASTNSSYATIGYSAANKAIAINEGHNATGQQGWRVFDTTQAGPTWTSHVFLNGSEAGGPGALGNTDAAMGAVFFKKGTDEYFMGSNEDVTRRFFIYKIVPGSNVADWSVY